MSVPSDAPARVIIAGYGLPGRSVADLLDQRGVPFRVIEFNADTVTRCARGGVPIISGDARDADVLRRAGVEQAQLLALTIPDDRVVLDIIEQARKLNPKVRIVARCSYTSTGMEASRRGAQDVVVAEQIVASEFSAIVSDRLNKAAM
ncbi:MAG: NAD-binding protein [Tepidisphaeraceae bacterium]